MTSKSLKLQCITPLIYRDKHVGSVWEATKLPIGYKALSQIISKNKCDTYPKLDKVIIGRYLKFICFKIYNNVITKFYNISFLFYISNHDTRSSK